MIIFLIGYMGAGKTSLATKLAARTGFKKIDTDKEIEKQEGLSVSEIFAQKGEDYFREKERDFLLTLNPDDKLIVSTGGGLPCFHDNMKLINAKGISFYIRLSAEKLFERLEASKENRPLIKNKNADEMLQFIRKHLEQRETFYFGATHTINGNRRFSQLCEEVIRTLKIQ